MAPTLATSYGHGPLDLVFVHVAPPIDLLSEDPGFVRVRRRLGSFSRTLWFDHRGMGSSEGDPRDSTAGDLFAADLTALLDAVGFERPALLGEGISGGRAIHFAAAHPERVSALVLLNTSPAMYPTATTPGALLLTASIGGWLQYRKKGGRRS
jgi:pimeloyl-ACP methyl ester carboxylesterase